MLSVPRLRRAAATAIAASALLLSGCSLLSASSSPGGVATNPPGTPITGTVTATPAASGGPSSAAAQSSGTRTVLATLGLNMHSAASLSAHVVGTLAWGDTVNVQAYNGSGGPWPGSTTPGAWYQVQGSTVTGWIVADPTLSAAGTLNSTSFGDKQIDGLLYPADWTYADNPGEILLQPQTGNDRPTIAIRVAGGLSALGATGITGYTPVTSNPKTVVCGYTGSEVEYSAPSGAAAQPTADAGGGQVTRLAHFVQFRATLQSSPPVAIDIEMNYASSDQEMVFANILNSIRYPFPLCEASPVKPTP
jgi:uncharacterized protein YgiM (DUF1202 family)